MCNPLISIVLPVWNGERYLAEAIESILAQTLTDFELIIVNDCSTDSSPDIAKQFAQKDSRIILVNNEKNLKLPASLNKGFAIARGRYFTWTSDDNRLLPECLQILYSGLVEYKADLVFSQFHSIDEYGVRIHTADEAQCAPLMDGLLYTNQIGASFLYAAYVHHALGGYNTSLFLIEDYDFWVRAYLKGFFFEYLSAAPYEYRRHAASLTDQHPINEVLIPFLYSIRNLFPNACAEAHYRNRATLLINGARFLTTQQKIVVLFESFRHAPLATLRGLYKAIHERIAGGLLS